MTPDQVRGMPLEDFSFALVAVKAEAKAQEQWAKTNAFRNKHGFK